MSITPIYASLIVVIFLILSVRVIAARRSGGVSLGDGGDTARLRRIRAQGNCAEYAPIGIVIMILMELQRSPDALVHTIGIALVGGRFLHAIALSSIAPQMIFRVAGMVLTFLALGIGVLAILIRQVI